MKSEGKKDYYQILQITKKASQQQVKQAYKKLALIHHPDKNLGAQQSKIKFTQISEAYTVLNDPKKRQNYDKYGFADIQGLNFQQFMSGFQGFQQFLSQVLSFNSFDAMFSGFNTKKVSKKNATKARGRAKGRQKNMSGKQMQQLMKMMGGDISGNIQMAMFEAMMEGGIVDLNDIQMLEKQIEKAVLESDQDQEEEWQLTQQEMQILKFGEKNIEKKKVGNKKKKKTQIRCKLDGDKIQQDQVLMHFTQNHMEQFKKWRQQNKNSTKKCQDKKQVVKQKKDQQQIQY